MFNIIAPEKIGNFSLGDVVSIDKEAYIIEKDLQHNYMLYSLKEVKSLYYKANDKSKLVNLLSKKASLLCNFICEESIKNSETLFRRDEKDTLLLEKNFEYPIDIYSKIKCPCSFQMLKSKNFYFKRVSYYPNGGLLLDSLFDNGHFKDVAEVSSIDDVFDLIVSGMLSEKEKQFLSDKYRMPLVDSIEMSV